MRSSSVHNFSRVIVSSSLLFFICGFQTFVSTFAAPIDSSIFSFETNKDSSETSELLNQKTGIIDGISYRLDAWSQYDNPEEGSEREGDIHDFPESRKTTTRDQKLLWPNGIVQYWIHPSIQNEPTKLSILKEAMETIMEKTCVKFQEIFPDENGKFPTSFSWVNITGNVKGCFSDVGCSRFGASNLNLDISRCFQTTGHAIHEMLHTLGVYHEHMRPDRDDHIKIVWSNVKESDVFNFRRMSTEKVTTYGLPYDYDSIMHYSMTAFARNKSQPTIIPLKQTTPIGQRDHLSLYDIKKLLITYKCTDIDSSVDESETDKDTEESNYDESNSIEHDNSLTETDIEDDIYNDNVDNYFDRFSDNQDFDAWSLLDLFNFGKFHLSPFYADYLYYLR